MWNEKKYKFQKFQKKVATFFKIVFGLIYFSSTALIPIYLFALVFFLKDSIIYAIAISFVSLTVMDIVCSIVEDVAKVIYNSYYNMKIKRKEKREKLQRKKEREIQELEKLLLESNSYNNEIEEAKKENEKFEKKIESNQEILSKEIKDNLLTICEKIKAILKILEDDPEEYYPIRHTFKVYLPEFQRMTYQYMNIAKGDSLEEENTTEFIGLITEFDKYLDFVKCSINIKDKLSLNVGIKSLIKIMETERKKGER